MRRNGWGGFLIIIVKDRSLHNNLIELFNTLTGEEKPFQWQQRLLQLLLDGKIPSAVDIPTGLGKTSVMALWLIALGENATLPRRLVYIVDRRAVVDQATRFAERLRRNMPDDLASNLSLKGKAGNLPISTLRGGFADNRDWLEDPAKPAIIVGTIDMIGSRLLFEGYGVSRRMRPYHAALLGVDSLLLLDEAHLCPPFEALIRQIEAQRNGKLGGRSEYNDHTPDLRLMALSATGRNLGKMTGTSVFRLEAGDSEETLVKQRLTAEKRVKIHEIDGEKSLAEYLADRAVELGGGSATPRRVLVYCHSRKTALGVKSEIDKQCRQRKNPRVLATEHKSNLLVGERRIYERKVLEEWLETNGFLGDSENTLQAPTFLVATSAGEVGVDMDADHMVCDLVAYERMVQRLGRVNRRGGEGRVAMVDVFAIEPAQAKSTKADKERYEKEINIYRNRIAALRLLRCEEDGRCNASPAAIAKLKLYDSTVVDNATTRPPLYPELTRPLLDAWSMTSLKQHEGRPEVAPWLRGWEEEDEPQTILVWRKYLPCVCRAEAIELTPSMVTDFFRSAPIHVTEKLEAPSGRTFEWLLKRVAQIDKQRRGAPHAIQNDEIVAIFLNQAGEYVSHADMRELRFLSAPAKNLGKIEKRNQNGQKQEWKQHRLPGALLILDARIGGLCDGMLDEKYGGEVAAADADPAWQTMQEDASTAQSPPIIGFRIEEVTSSDQEEALVLPDKIAGWRHVYTFETEFNVSGVAQRGLAIFKYPGHETGEEARSIASTPQSLADHSSQTAACARDIATRLNLPNQEVEAIALAAELHDKGKAAPRWQNAMNAPKNGQLYAKTSGGGNWRLLEGYRHEFGSLLKAESANLPDETRDLILHLIASHHGHARPIIRSRGCEDGPPSLLESKAGEAALRFARLQKRYGPWGLAWREAILRAADQNASRTISGIEHNQNDG